MESSSVARRACFMEEDDGLASLVDVEAGFSGNHQNKRGHPFLSRYGGRRSSIRNLSVLSSPVSSSPRSGKLYETRFDDHHQPHFLEACFLCKKPLSDNRDIFMYRGDTPFCSEECRQEQIEMDEAKERSRNISYSRKALRQKDHKKSTSPAKSKEKYPSCAGTVAAA